MIVDDFQPGDGTRYIMVLQEYRDPRWPAIPQWLFSCPNHGLSFGWPKRGRLSLADVEVQLRNGTRQINPWTLRAFLLFAMMHTELEVSLEGCPE